MSTPVVVSVLVALVAVVGAAVLWLLLRNRSAAPTQVKRGAREDPFARLAAARGLREAEVLRLRALLAHEPSAAPQLVFQSIDLFERCLHQEALLLGSSALPAAQCRAEEALLASIRNKLGYAALATGQRPASTRNIAIGQNGSLYGTQSSSPLVYHATVVENGLFALRVQYSPQQEGAVDLAVGAEVRFVFPRPHDGLYLVALSVAEHDPADTVAFHHSLQLQRNQMRHTMRVEADIALQAQVFLQAGPAQAPQWAAQQVVQGRMLDLSAGGLSFVCGEPLAAGMRLVFSFDLPREHIEGLHGTLLRVGTLQAASGIFPRYHVEFAGVDPRHSAAISAYVLGRQRRLYQWR